MQNRACPRAGPHARGFLSENAHLPLFLAGLPPRGQSAPIVLHQCGSRPRLSPHPHPAPEQLLWQEDSRILGLLCPAAGGKPVLIKNVAFGDKRGQRGGGGRPGVLSLQDRKCTADKGRPCCVQRSLLQDPVVCLVNMQRALCASRSLTFCCGHHLVGQPFCGCSHHLVWNLEKAHRL